MTITVDAAAPAAVLTSALRAAAAGRAVRSVTIDLPAAHPDPIALAAHALAAGEEVAAWLRPAEGIAIAGIGRAWATEPSGPARFAEAAAAWTTLAGDLEGAVRTAPAGPLLLGGLGFSGTAPAAGDPWAPFGAASLVLPELLLTVVDGQVTLTATVASDATDEAIEALARRWERLAAMASGATGDVAVAPSRPASATSTPDRAAWDRLVRLAAGAVGRGRIDKVVLARRIALEGLPPVDPATILQRLAAAAADGAVYAFGRDGRLFLGVTPERLVRTDDRAFRTIAVAGSTRRGVTPAADAADAAALLASDKDREEHAIVVASLRERLAPIAERIDVAPEPVILPLRHVQHLATTIEGRLRDRTGTLAVAAALHPTPAVAGEPLDGALALIAEHEGFDRGWYAGPVGWLTPDGDGELMVALRGGIVAGDRAWLFAGCGIVADSDPDREWEESRLKLRVMLEALGAEEAP